MKRIPTEEKNVTKTIIDGSISFTIVGVISKGLLFLLSWVMIRSVYTTNEVGEYSVLLNTYLFITSFTFGISARIIMIKEVSTNSKNFTKLRSIVSSFLLFQTIGTVAVIIYFAVVYGFNIIYEPAFLPSLFLLAFAVTEKLSTVCGFFLGMKKYKIYNIIQLVMVVSHVVVSITLAFIFKYFTAIPPYYAVFIGLITKSIVGTVISLICMRRVYGSLLTLKIGKEFLPFMKEVLIVGGVYFLNSVIITQSVLILWSISHDLPIITAFSLVQKTGTNFVQLISIFLGGMLMSIIPTYIKQKRMKEAEKITGKVAMVIFFIATLLLFTLTMFAKEFVWLFYGEENIQQSVILWFACFQVLWCVTKFGVNEVFITLKKSWVLYIILLIRVGVFFGCAYLLTPIIGIYGMLISVAVSYSIAMVLNFLSLKHIGKINTFKYYWSMFINYILYQIFFLAVYIKCEDILWGRIVLFISLLGLYIFTLLRIIVPKSDIDYAVSFIKSKMKEFKSLVGRI